LKNEEVVEQIQKYHETRIGNLEDDVDGLGNHISTLSREVGEVKGEIKGIREIIDNNNFWLKVIGIGTPGTTFVLWIVICILERYWG